MKKALIAMSGGVDSSVAAYLTIKDGYTPVGATMRLYCEKEGACGSEGDILDAKKVAERLGMEHHVIDFTKRFGEKVIKNFIDEYERGATPNPCIECNRHLKFAGLLEKMEELSCECVVTGHYAQTEAANGRFLLKKAVDASKDQSYVLYSMTQKQLAAIRFPLGAYTKEYAREIAGEQGFINAKKRDSQDICFVPDGDYAAFIEKYTGKKYPEGDFVDLGGNVLGRHKGIIKYTVGQRKGLGLALLVPMYVKEKDLQNNRVILSSNEELFSRSLDAEDFNWIAFDSPPESLRVKAKIRYNQREEPATVFATGENLVHIEFDSPQRAIAKGQAVVLYDGDIVIGGGKIKNADF